MKRILPFPVVFCLLFSLCACGGNPNRAEPVQGTALTFENGTHAILTAENEVILLTDSSQGQNLFTDICTGDTIAVIYGPVQETYPARADAYQLERVRNGTAEIPEDIAAHLAALGWELADTEETVTASGQTVSAVTEPYSGEAPSVELPQETEPYFAWNQRTVSPLEMPDRATVIPSFREQMGDTPREVPRDQLDSLIRQINALDLHGYDRNLSRLMLPAGSDYRVRLYYREQVVTFAFCTGEFITVQFPEDEKADWFADQSGNFDALLGLLWSILAV